MSIKAYKAFKNGQWQTNYYFHIRYKDSMGYTRQRKGTGFATYEECKKALEQFKEDIYSYLPVPYDELLSYYREHHR